MFDVGFSELVLLGIVALVVLGPEKLPHAARMAGAWLGRIRRAMTGIQIEIEKEVAAQEMRDRINKEIARLKSSEAAFNEEVNEVENTIRQTVASVSAASVMQDNTPAPTEEAITHSYITAEPAPNVEPAVAPASPPSIDLEKPPTP
jgi:sec-independent protein translocase protein TatB